MTEEQKLINVQIGKRLQTVRENMGYTQEAFAEVLSVDAGHYQKLVQIPLHRITDSASNGSVFPVVTEHFSASSDHAFL